MKKKIITGREMFDFLTNKYGTRDKTTAKITGYRNLCEIIPVKIFPEENNSNGKNKAALVFHEDLDMGDFSILFCSSVPNNGNIDRILREIRPNLHPENPKEINETGNINISFGEKSGCTPRVSRIRISHDKFDVMVRIIACYIELDIISLTHLLPCER